jgi:hypothetical protein
MQHRNVRTTEQKHESTLDHRTGASVVHNSLETVGADSLLAAISTERGVIGVCQPYRPANKTGGWNRSDRLKLTANRRRRHDFPTPLSPISTSLNR